MGHDYLGSPDGCTWSCLPCVRTAVPPHDRGFLGHVFDLAQREATTTRHHELVIHDGGWLLLPSGELPPHAHYFSGGLSTVVVRSQPRSTNVDQGRPRSTKVGQGRPWSTTVDQCRPRSTNVDIGRPWSTKVDQGRPWSTMVDHGRPLSTNVDHVRPRSTMVDHGRPWSTMVVHCRSGWPLVLVFLPAWMQLDDNGRVAEWLGSSDRPNVVT